MLERTQVFVDTSYLLASFYNSWDTGARAQLEIDLPEVVSVLGQMVSDQLKQPVHRQFWYDGIPESGPHRYQRSLRSEPGVQLRAGQLIEWGDRRTQKAVDTRLVADMVIAAMKNHVSDIVLVSGDADMLPGVEEAVNAGIRVHLYGFGWDSMSSALRFACDTTTILDPREDFRDTMRLQILEGPLPAGEQPAEPAPKPLGDATSPEEPTPCVLTSPTSRGDATPPQDTPTTDTAATTDQPAAETKAPEPAEAAPTTTPSEKKKEGEAEVASPQSKRPIPGPVRSGPGATSRGTEPVGANEEPAKETAQEEAPKPRPNPGMMARHRKLRSRYVPLPNEVWASAGEQNPYDIGQQYAVWWYDHAATEDQKDNAHLLSGGGLPPEIDRPLLQFACETLHEYTLTESQRVGLRDGFHSGIRGIMLR
ncbi:MAG TPA: NYN domain-containing protein [Candidatus Corynebacterium gallistercoris]|uniref:NYN domain-containing protein n=1 Tax=Candidatus Corynebacterium gallistercoris TaxID=2838530 RepID=A0A9D1RVR0_9CORY|nr:NYN domain-containing protein [Candidatus Corynebacterium gallistercoris]